MKIPQHHFSLADVETLLTQPITNANKSITQVGTTAASLQPDIDFINKYWPELLIGFGVLLILTSIIANLITRS